MPTFQIRSFATSLYTEKKAENRVFHLGSISQGQDKLSDVNHLRSLSQDVGLQYGNKQKGYTKSKQI